MGRIILYTGPMFSGKAIYNYALQLRRLGISQRSTRGASQVIHDGKSLNARSISKDEDITTDESFLLVDEIQFFTSAQVSKIVNLPVDYIRP